VRLIGYICFCIIIVSACSNKPIKNDLEAKYLAMEMAEDALWQEEIAFGEFEEFAEEDFAQMEEGAEIELGNFEYLRTSYPSSCSEFYYWLPDSAFSLTTLIGTLSIADRERLLNDNLDYWDLIKADYYTIRANNTEENATFTLHYENKDGYSMCFLTQTLAQNSVTNVFKFDYDMDQLNNINYKLPSIKLRDFVHPDQGIRYEKRFNSADYISLIYDKESDEMAYVLDAFHFGLELNESSSSLNIDSNIYSKLLLTWDSDSSWVTPYQ
jgi:hypothetical protein